MKTILFSIFAVLAIGSTAEAQYSTSLCWGGGAEDAGHYFAIVQPATGGCKCSAASQGCAGAWLTAPGGTCSTGMTAGDTADGRLCCLSGPCMRTPEEIALEKEEIKASLESGLDGVFGEGSRATYWGYMDAVLKSPSAGRANAPAARLDGCLGHSTVSTYTPGNNSHWISCKNSCDSATNGWCDASGVNDGSTTTAYVCKDRCDCYVGNGVYGTCEGQ